MRFFRFQRKVIVCFGCISKIVRGRGIILGRGRLRLRLLVGGGRVGRLNIQISLDKFVSRNLFAQPAMVGKDLPEFAMIPQIKCRRVYLVVSGYLSLQASDGAASPTETSCVRPSDGPIIDFDQHRRPIFERIGHANDLLRRSLVVWWKVVSNLGADSLSISFA